ncbi:MFS transporter [Candidatus Hydrogenisulfobacillus filiaventi]|uniref:MFS transporter n=1 Tax=Candidatus Hydrogenisulfobacillus filiaventi TaxID=2707344 RepID=A0A6F8ZFF8_9FIRM|nr:MFS transporter [Bacillota bacterium]CAB1128329.1 MFS transporter [Candidatus Hydrogenisulfobacillus filiaventi]
MWEHRGIGTSEALLIAVLTLAEFVRGALLISLLPAYVTGPLGQSLTVVGWAVSSHYLLDTVFRGPAGWLVDWLGPPRVLTIGLAIEVSALVGAMNTTHPVMVVVFVGLLGIGTATHWPAVVTGTNRLTDPERRASVMGMVFAAWIAGSGFGPVAINFLLRGHDHLAFLILVLTDVVAFAVTLVIYDPRLFRTNAVHMHWKGRLSIVRPFWMILPGMFLQNMTLGMMLPIVRPFTTNVLHLSPFRFAELLFGSGALTVLLLVPMGRITDRFGLRVPLVGGMFVAGAALSAIGVLRAFLPLMLAGGVAGLSYAMILPAWNAFVAALIPKRHEGWLWGFFMTVEGLGMAVGPILGTRLYGLAPWMPFLLSAAILTTMGFFYIIYVPVRPAR